LQRLQSDRAGNDPAHARMRNFETTIEKAEGEIVFALGERLAPRVGRPPKEPRVRRPVSVENRDLQAAIDDMLAKVSEDARLPCQLNRFG
jgi:hypothetical protein